MPKIIKGVYIHDQLNFLGYGYGYTGGIPTTDNIPETTEKLGYPNRQYTRQPIF